MKGLTRYNLFAVCTPGLEDILYKELSDLGIEGVKTRGGVEFSGDLLTVYSANLWLRTASRVLVRIGSFRLSSLKKAKDCFVRYPWEIYLTGAKAIRIRASCHKSRIYHSGALSERLCDAIGERLGRKVILIKEGKAKREPLIFVRMLKDRCTLSVDASGEHLHKRGFKTLSVKAPLRENLAAAMLIASNYDGTRPLLDPFCGSGTIVFEAAMIACRIPPGRHRRFAFMEWSTFDRRLWNEVVKRSEAFFRKPLYKIEGSDRDEAAIQSAIANAEAGGLSDLVSFRRVSFRNIRPETGQETGILVSNPPYGKRLKENNSLLAFYKEFGQIFIERFRGWDISLILPKEAPMLKKSLGLRLKPLTAFSNGGLTVELLSSITGKP